MKKELVQYTPDELDHINRGNALIKLLGLKVKRNGRVDTEWGDKTPLGLFLTVQRVINGEKA